MSVRHHLKSAVLHSLRTLGGNRLVADSRWRRRRLLILCYHGFSRRDEHLWKPSLYITARQFEERLDLLHRGGYRVLPLAEALRRLAEGTLPPRAVALTVDDGAYDFLSVAYPILQRRGIPATVYVTTYHVECQLPVFNTMVQYLCWRGVGRPARTVRVEGLAAAGLGTAAEAKAAALALIAEARRRGLGALEKDALLEDIAPQVGVDYAALKRDRVLMLMDREEIRRLDRGVADVQLHTHRHRVPEDREAFLRELSDNRASLADAGCDPASLVHFCYPSGVHRPAFLPWLREAGIASATTCRPGLAAPEDDPLLLPRLIDTGTLSSLEFLAWASGVRQRLLAPPAPFEEDH